MLDGLAFELASQAHEAQAGRTVAQYKEPWNDFNAWAMHLGTHEDQIIDIQPLIVVMYLMHVYQSAQADKVGHG